MAEFNIIEETKMTCQFKYAPDSRRLTSHIKSAYTKLLIICSAQSGDHCYSKIIHSAIIGTHGRHG